MTVTYAAKVATCKGLGVFWKLLFSWRASIYKLIWPNLLLYVLCWYALKGIYLLVPDNDFRYYFIKSSMYCNSYSQFIPLTFILGFYVNLVVKRWWEMFQALPGLDTIAIFVSTSIHGQDERSRLLRRTIMRYLNLSYVMVMSMISTPVKKRFPTMKHMEEAGLMNDNEHAIFEEMNKKSKLAKYWMPIVWAGSIVSRARKEGRIRDDFAVKTLLDELCKFRSGCGSVLGYDWVPIPLVYTQVVTIAVYSYCVSTLCGSQFSFKAFKSDIEKQFASEFTSGEVNGAEYVRGHSDTNIIYFPLFDFLQFFFYMGWMKVAESLVNPFGEDDDDFETNFLVDKNLTNTYLIVDEMHQEHPTLLKDQFWDSIVPELPYTYATEKYHKDPHMGSAANISIDSEDGEFVPMEALEEEEEEVAMGDEENQVGSVSDKDKPDSRKGSFRRSSISASDRFSRIGSRPNLRQKASMISTIAKVFGSRADSVAGSRVSLASTRRNTRRISRQNSTQGPMTRNTTAADEIFNMSGLSLNKLDGHYENGLSGSRANIAGKHNPSEPIKIDGASVAEGDKPNFVIGSDTSAKKMMVYCGDDLDMVDAELPVTARPHTRLDSLLEDDAEDRPNAADNIQYIDEESAPLIDLGSPFAKVVSRSLKLQIPEKSGSPRNSPKPPRKDIGAPKASPVPLDSPSTPKSVRLMSPLSILIDGASSQSTGGSPQGSPRSSKAPKLGSSKEKQVFKPVREEEEVRVHRDSELETIEEDLEKSVDDLAEESNPLINPEEEKQVDIRGSDPVV